MPRTARAIQAGLIYHVLNRGNGRMRLFHDEQDYAAFEGALASQTLAGLEACVNRGQPWGSAQWVQATTVRLGLEYSFRAVGRPRKPNNEAGDGENER